MSDRPSHPAECPFRRQPGTPYNPEHGPPANGDWEQNRKFLFYRLDNLEDGVEKIDKRIGSVEKRVAAIVGGIMLLGWAIPAAAELLARMKG